jgi:hypothetical protein
VWISWIAESRSMKVDRDPLSAAPPSRRVRPHPLDAGLLEQLDLPVDRLARLPPGDVGHRADLGGSGALGWERTMAMSAMVARRRTSILAVIASPIGPKPHWPCGFCPPLDPALPALLNNVQKAAQRRRSAAGRLCCSGTGCY